MYDVIVVGARVAGAATAMLLARRGMRVLVVDRASFPSDTLSTHLVQLPGVARLAEWGLLDRVTGAGTPVVRRLRFDAGPVLEGRYPSLDGVDGVVCPRRTRLDQVLVDAAREAGAEVRETFAVEEVLAADGRVTGVRGAERRGQPVTETARLVVGADGKHSMVARAVGAAEYHELPVLSMACYGYWEGVPLSGGEIYSRPGRMAGAFPTDDGLTVTYMAWPAAEFATFRSDVDTHVHKTLDLMGTLGDRVRAGRLVEHFRTTPDLPNRFRVPYGPGWALAGDAGVVLDPATGHGIGHAFAQAHLLARAVAAGFDGGRLDREMRRYQRARDALIKPMYDFNADIAGFVPPPPPAQALFGALADRPEEVTRFIGMLTGSVPVRQYFAPPSLARVLGWRKVLRLAAGAARRPRS
jgi:flavin-dependent dehydrogenase